MKLLLRESSLISEGALLVSVTVSKCPGYFLPYMEYDFEHIGGGQGKNHVIGSQGGTSQLEWKLLLIAFFPSSFHHGKVALTLC